MQRLVIATLAGAVSSIAVAACGGSSDTSSSSTQAPAASSAAAPAATAAASTEDNGGGGSTGDAAAGKTVFTANCGTCHALKDAGTTGSVGPDLDQLAPGFDTVEHQVENGGRQMPAFKRTLSDADIANVSAYVSSVAGK